MKTKLKISIDPSDKEQVRRAYNVLRALAGEMPGKQKETEPVAFKLEEPATDKPKKKKKSKTVKEAAPKTEKNPAEPTKEVKKPKGSTANKLNTIRELVARNQQTNRAQMVGWLKDNKFDKVASIPAESYDDFIEFLSAL